MGRNDTIPVPCRTSSLSTQPSTHGINVDLYFLFQVQLAHVALFLSCWVVCLLVYWYVQYRSSVPTLRCSSVSKVEVVGWRLVRVWTDQLWFEVGTERNANPNHDGIKG
ncbi:hypothetical protein M758_9G057700 [Ceratodon purpureus]|nr:hypothetical protein M758_9G057700 [Ceratodon purpureus]